MLNGSDQCQVLICLPHDMNASIYSLCTSLENIILLFLELLVFKPNIWKFTFLPSPCLDVLFRGIICMAFYSVGSLQCK